MCEASREDWIDKTEVIKKQVRETVDQSNEGVVGRLMTITCTCGWKRGVMHMYQCLYCKVWMCQNCAEVHFGKTVEEHKMGKHEHP